MTVYLVDTNIIAYLADVGSPYHENIRAHFQALTDEDSVCLSILTLYELYYSLAKAQESAVSQAIIRTKEQICATLPCLPLSESGARIFGELKMRYQKYSGVKKNVLDRATVDLVIASTAIESNAILVSNDDIYGRVQSLWPDFRWENWTV